MRIVEVACIWKVVRQARFQGRALTRAAVVTVGNHVARAVLGGHLV